MSEDDEPVSATPGSMVEHIQKYKDYIQDLKQGKSSGISAAFGKANDLLPADVMAVPLTVAPAPGPAHAEQAPFDGALNMVVIDSEQRGSLRDAVEELILSCADHLAEYLGVPVATEDGESEVINVFMEDGVRKFMLGNLDVLDQDQFEEHRLDRAAPDGANIGPTEIDEPAASEFGSEELEKDETATVELLIPDSRGNHLWTVAFRGGAVAEIVMADGSQISRAHGRDEFIYVDRADKSPRSDVFILTALMVDPSTGNIYGEVNEGAVNIAFLNNGWHIRQYRSGTTTTCFVREPAKGNARSILIEVSNLELDVMSGEASYETLDSAATTTLKSRKIR